MDFGALEVQIFVSLVLVLGALFVALVCDFLKGNNEMLREHNIELVVRQEERQRHTGAAARREATRAPAAAPAVQPPRVAPAARPVPESFAPAAPASETVRLERDEESEVHAQTWATEQELDEVEEMARRIRSRATPSAPERSASPEKRPAGGRDGVSGTAQPNPGPRSPSGPAAEPPREVSAVRTSQPGLVTKITPIDVLTAERTAAAEALDLARELERVAELNAIADEELEPAIAGPPAFSRDDAMDADDIETAPVTEAAAREHGDSFVQIAEEERRADFDPSPIERLEGFAAFAEAVQTAGAAAEQIPECKLEAPAGYHEAAELTALLEQPEPFTGTVVAIGVSALTRTATTDAAADVSVPSVPVEDFIRTLLAPADFGCPYGKDEYVLVMPNDCGGPAQRRLQYLSQRLWDYQIRSIGADPVMFSWGSAEGKGELLSLILDAARDRMSQTRRTRERAPAEIHRYGRRAASL